MPPSNTAVQLTYQVCPIILTGGIATQSPGGLIPMLSLLLGAGFNSLGLPFDIGDLDDAFGAFNVLAGGTLISQTIAKYPFANQNVAANATIVEPLTLSLIMDAPMRTPQAFAYKQMMMTGLQQTLANHNNGGGTYTVMTPAFMYQNLILVSLTDNSRSNNSLPQNAWRFDFEKPLIALEDLQGAQNLLMSKASGGLVTDGNQSGPQPGLMGPQPALIQDPNTQLGGNLTSLSGATAQGVAGTYMNYPAIANAASFPFTNIP
jgi:hypothetical protein